MADRVATKLGNLNIFSKTPVKAIEEENYGDIVDPQAIAGGGRSARQTATTDSLRVSPALKTFLVDRGVLSPQDAGLDSDSGTSDPVTVTEVLRALLNKSHVEVPPELTDRNHPLPEYFISSSHNTYLTANQLTGGVSAAMYETALRTGSRCVEIDAWDNKENPDEPKVTHGYTLVQHVPFRAVCETMRDVIDKEAAEQTDAQGYKAAPIFLSLENHCSAAGQKRLVEIMKEVWGDRMLSKPVRDKAHLEQQGVGNHVTLAELNSDIVLIVEYHLQKLTPAESQGQPLKDEDSSTDDDSDEEEKAQHREYRKQAAETSSVDIIPELAELGVYAQSVKPVDNSWFELVKLTNGPHHHLINLSEVGLAGHMPVNNQKIANHNAHHLMRVYPKGSRIMSKNLQPVPFWGIGAQICALNWQTFGHSLQLNDALFAGTDGYVLKPAPLRAGGDGNLNTGLKKKLRLHVGGATDIPMPEGRKDPIKPYVTCLLYHPGDVKSELPKRKTSAYKQHNLAFLHEDGEGPASTDPIWDEVLEWEYDDNELVFLRILIKSDDSFAINPHLAATSLRLLYAVPGWNFIRMLDLKGRETKCSLLCKVEIVDV